MTITLVGTCYSQVTDQERGFRAVIGVNDPAKGGAGVYRLSRRWFTREAVCLDYGKRLFFRLAQSGKWELIGKEREN